MEIISFEKRAFEEVAAKLDYFVQRVDNLCSLPKTAYQSEDIADTSGQRNSCFYQNREPDLLSSRRCGANYCESGRQEKRSRMERQRNLTGLYYKKNV